MTTSHPPDETPENPTHEMTLSERPDDVDSSLAALDEPIDHRSLHDRMVRHGLARSTRWLLAGIAAVALFGLGAFVGRTTAPAPAGPTSPPVAGVVESVAPAPDGATLTLRSADGSLTTMLTNPGTRVSVVRRNGIANLTRGTGVEVSTQQGLDGALTATRIDLTTAG